MRGHTGGSRTQRASPDGAVGSAGRAARQVEIVLMPGVNPLKSVALHQLKNLASLRLFEVVLDGERAELVSIERKAAERFKLSPFDVKAHEIDLVRRLRPRQDVAKGDGGELD